MYVNGRFKVEADEQEVNAINGIASAITDKEISISFPERQLVALEGIKSDLDKMSKTEKELSVTANGTYQEDGVAYTKVDVDVKPIDFIYPHISTIQKGRTSSESTVSFTANFISANSQSKLLLLVICAEGSTPTVTNNTTGVSLTLNDYFTIGGYNYYPCSVVLNASDYTLTQLTGYTVYTANITYTLSEYTGVCGINFSADNNFGYNITNGISSYPYTYDIDANSISCVVIPYTTTNQKILSEQGITYCNNLLSRYSIASFGTIIWVKGSTNATQVTSLYNTDLGDVSYGVVNFKEVDS